MTNEGEPDFRELVANAFAQAGILAGSLVTPEKWDEVMQKVNEQLGIDNPIEEREQNQEKD